MELIMDKNFKQKYQKYKYIVKKWEKDFKQRKGRIPSKYDIKEASKEIRDSYKMYYKLKTSFLEDTLGDVLSEDGFDEMFENSQSEFNFGASENDSEFSQRDSQQSTFPKNLFSLIDPDNSIHKSPTKPSSEEQKSETGNNNTKNNENMSAVCKNRSSIEFEAIAELESNKTAWLNCAPTKIVSSISASGGGTKLTLKTLNTKLFSSQSFSKRNPRKSLSRSQSATLSKTKSQDLFSSSQETLPDLEAILIAKSQETKIKDIMTNKEGGKILLNRKINQGWLNRCTSDYSELITSTSSTTTTTNIDSDLNETVERKVNNFGISNINIYSLQKASVSQKSDPNNDDSDSVISNSEDESTSRDLHINKKRRIFGTILSRDFQKSQTSDEALIETKTVNKILPQQQDIKEESKNNNKLIEIEKTVEKDDHSEKKLSQFKSGSRQSQRNRKKVLYKEGNVSSDDADSIRKNLNKIDDDMGIEKSPPKTSKKRVPKTSKKQVPKTDRKKPQKLRKKNVEEKYESNVPNEDEENIPKDVEFNLDLGDGILTSIPRVNIEEINQAEIVMQKYVSVSDNHQQTKLSSVANKEISSVEAKKKKLEMKIATGKLNENFVRIDLKKKIFVRGKKNTNYSKYKKKMWKQKKAAALCGPDMDMRGCDGGTLTCFTCGQPGHFAKNCNVKGDNLMPFDAEKDEDDSLFPTLDEAEQMAAQQSTVVHSRNIEQMPEVSNELLYKDNNDTNGNNSTKSPNEIKEKYIGHVIPEDFLQKCGLLENDGTKNSIEPLYSLNADGSLQQIPAEVYEVLHMFGHLDFRKGQDKAVMRILSGLSTLVTLSTGSGKSLCYQLPAYLYSRKLKCLTLVISPLVSLMEDQIHDVPHFLRAHCLHTNQTPQQKENVLDLINRGEVDVLLVSPEAIVAGEKSTSGFGSILRKLPPIAFACIDEAHCVSQWSHNFRPSYLMICKVLREKLNIKTILGLTATATISTKQSIIRHLAISDGENGIISDIPLPDNLLLSISNDFNRDAALIQLLKSERFYTCQSIIVYCTRREECERIARFIRTCFQQEKTPAPTNKRKRVNWYAEAYHAGMSASRRRTVQNAFMRNELRVIVATIAFGMGINKPDIRAIIHYNIPKAFESYVQEIGRAGRDGKQSHCHLFLDSTGSDQNELKRHIYANSFDRYVIRKLLQKLFIPCSCNKNLEKREFFESQNDFKIYSENVATSSETINSQVENRNEFKRKCPGHEIGFSIEETVRMLDITEENISTLLCYLELDGRWNLKVLSNAYVMCKVISYGGPKHLKQAAKECPPLAMAIALQIKNNSFDPNTNIIEFPIIEISSAIGWNSGIAKYQLKNLEWTTVNNLPKRSCITVTFYDLGFRVKAPGDLTDDELDEALDALYNRSMQQETKEIKQLQYILNGLSSLAFNSYISCCANDFSTERSDKLKNVIRDYFQNDYSTDVEISRGIDATTDDEIISDVLSMINMYPENQFTGRTLARIFYGIQSPNYPALIWSRCKYWRAHSKCDFSRLIKLANSVIMKIRT